MSGRVSARSPGGQCGHDHRRRALYPCGVGAGVGTALIAAGPVGLAVGGTMSALGTLQQRLVAARLSAAKLTTALGGPPQVTAFDLLTALGG